MVTYMNAAEDKTADKTLDTTADKADGRRVTRQANVYPHDLTATTPGMDVITPAEAKTIDGLFRARVLRSPNKTAYFQYCAQTNRWTEYTWAQVAAQVAQWRRALAAEGFAIGARVAIRMRNRVEWMIGDQACMAVGLVVTPLYFEDRADNSAYIIEHSGAQLLFVENAGMWRHMASESPRLKKLARVVVLEDSGDELAGILDARVMSLARWLEHDGEHDGEHDSEHAAGKHDASANEHVNNRDDLATIVYTSGTTGKPKGVMLSHANMLMNAHAGIASVPVFPSDKFLSFLPLSHMFERTVGYYLPMMAGASVGFNRNIAKLNDDLEAIRPTLMITVPRIFERAHDAIQTDLAARSPAVHRWLSYRLFKLTLTIGWRRFEIAQKRASWGLDQLLMPLLRVVVAKNITAKFGGNLRYVICGGAPLAANISRTFIALGIPILQGYGLTETGPTLSVNTPNKNKPSSIGLPLIGNEIKLSHDRELHARGASIMLGYWQNAEATRACLDSDGWFASGDLAAIDEDGFISITGRIKEIIVLATGEKVPPADMESAICEDALFKQVMVVGEGRSFLCALLVLNRREWARQAAKLGFAANDDRALNCARVEKYMLDKVANRLQDFPGYAVVRRVWAITEAWTINDGSITPTLKIKRSVVRARFKTHIENLYAGH